MLTYANIKTKVQGIVGETIDDAMLAQRIDEAQIEIAKRYGKRSTLWYPPARTTTAEGIGNDDDEIILTDSIPIEHLLTWEYGKELILGVYTDREFIRFDDINLSTHTLLGVDRGLKGSKANVWPLGTEVRVPVEARMNHDIPDDCVEVHEVRDIDDNPVFEYQIDEQMEITFFQDDLHKLIYTPVPEGTDYEANLKPNVHPIFHKDIITYCVAKHWEDMAEGIQGEEQKAARMLNQFYANIEDSARPLRRRFNQQYKIDFRLW